MPHLPRLSGQEAGAAFEKLGYQLRRVEGSHMIYKAVGKRPLSIPNHKELDVGLLRRLIRDAGITPKQFADLLR
jgi:predicted RNA binding protein YcfA (HicA-like mRNA interferase family)